MREFWRVLSPNGWALILVPIVSRVTYEDPGITDPVERERTFGQLDHVRNYGLDVQNRLENAGFHVTQVSTRDIASGEDLNRMGLEDNEILFICKKGGE